MKILVLDNYDSFTYNLVHLLKECGAEIEVQRNDKISIEEAAKFAKIVLSPGPGIPCEAGIMPELIKRAAAASSILGVCLGHQAIGEAFGGSLMQAPEIVHGKASEVTVEATDEPLFLGVPKHFKGARYHSWVVSPDGFPNSLEVTARDESGNIMALRHRELKVRGVQFHPESVLTEYGREMIKNWLAS